MKALDLFLLSTLTTCLQPAAIVDDTVTCYVCESSPKDAYCTDTDLGVQQAGCQTCAILKVGEARYIRECLDEWMDDLCEAKPRKGQVCFCSTDLCNGDVSFKPVIMCHVCASTADNKCTDTDLGEVFQGCSSCAIFQLGENRYQRECLQTLVEDSCQIYEGQQVCKCNADLCNAKVHFKPLLKCYVCDASQSGGESQCTACDLGKVRDGCASCVATKLDEDSFLRECSPLFEADSCEMHGWEQLCVCNTALCNGWDIFQNVIRCYACAGESIDDTTSCTDSIFGDETEDCLSCSTTKIKKNVFQRGCETIYMSQGCLEVANTCFCDTELCNVEDVFLPIMKCYACEKKNPTDARCNVHNSGRVKSGCLTCRMTLEKGITTRECLDYALAPGSETIDDEITTHCNTDLCNGEGEDRVDDVTTSDPENCGLQKTVSSRVLIGGVLLATLGLNQLFSCQT